MYEPPQTRHSLILRLPDRTDVAAWDEFVAIYEPLVYRLARQRGFQHADAQEIVQEVLLAVSGAVERWVPDASRGRFRDWLFRIARNLMINHLTRTRYRTLATGDSAMAHAIENQCQSPAADDAWIDLEYRREVFRWAAEQARAEVRPTTWSAFWRTSVEGTPIAEVADDLAMTVGAVYIARSRVMARLREISRSFDDRDSATPGEQDSTGGEK